MIRAVLATVAAGWLALAGGPAAAALKCAPSACTTPSVVAEVRAAIEQQCPCAQQTKKGAYVKCANRVIKTERQRIGRTNLPKACLKAIRQAVGNATCGRAGTVACNVRNKRDTKTSCKVVAAAKCKGSACAAFTSCADACNPSAEACATTTTTTSSTTTTTAPAVVCGDGQVTGTEQCDPPCSDVGAGQICDGTCQIVTPEACACGAFTQMRFTSQVGSGTCGTTLNTQGSEVFPLQCGGLYFGGGANAVPLPAAVPDLSTSFTKVCCSGTTLHIGPTTAADTGSERNCTTKGCLFGAPLPIPNYSSRPISTCIINVVDRDAAGQGECTTGESTLDLPLRSQVYLIGDLLNGSTPERPEVPGLQACPICSKTCSTLECNNTPGTACTPGTEVADCGSADTCILVRPCTDDTDCAGGGTCGAATQCIGGKTHGGACTPETSAFAFKCDNGPPNLNGTDCTSDADCGGGRCGAPYPTSQDCLPADDRRIGELPIAFNLTTGTTTVTAQNLSAGSENPGSSTRVFCGFCRDTDNTYNFGVCVGGTNDGTPCAAQDECPGGACGDLRTCASSADCSQPREACEQRDNGAFFGYTQPQPLGGVVNQISMTGQPAGDMTDGLPHPSKLVSIFCIPPVLDPSVDASADLPGPGAVALQGEAQLLP